MNILITGANGQLGNEMRIVAKDSSDHFTFTDVTAPDGMETELLDITDVEAVRRMVRGKEIDVIVNCAAYTNVDKAEDDREFCELLNAKAVKNLAVAMQEAGGLLVHISTDYVFGGDPYNTPCKEDQQGTPTGVYGMTKLLGERNIIETCNRYVIIRTAWLYSEFGKNFVKTMLSLTSTKPQLKVVFDQCGTPTYAYDLAVAIETILERVKSEKPDCSSAASAGQEDSSLTARPSSLYGIYHFSNEGVCSWYDFTKMIAEFSGNTACDIQPCHSDEFPSKVKRPAYSVLDKTKIKETFGVRVPYWIESLRRCIAKMEMSDKFWVTSSE